MINLPRLMIAAPASGGGKTTVTCALLRALLARGKTCISWKCGPDYIDPMFHRESLGVTRSGSLDLFLCPEKRLLELFCRESAGMDYCIIEGVMGYYDGLGGREVTASSWDVARATQTPVVLVVNAKGSSVSVAALIQGFMQFRTPSRIAAVILNQVSPMFYPILKEVVERECGIPVAGYLPPMADCAFESRHLGLVMAGETPQLKEKLDRLAAQAAQSISLPLLEALATNAPTLTESAAPLPHCTPVRVAVARDDAFCFTYWETLSLLERMGATLCFFSPLRDKQLPKADALLLSGGYPELHAAALSANRTMRESVAQAVMGGMPTIAECGGFLYLHTTLEGTDHVCYPMAGVIDAHGFATEKLQRFGYAQLTAREDMLLCGAGEALQAHEFHYWDSTAPGTALRVKKPMRTVTGECAHCTKTLYAGFPHLYPAGQPETAARFLNAAADYGRRREHDA